MSAPVWTLSVDLQAKTATFQSGMSAAAKAARGSFQDIKDGAADMGKATGGSMMEARHGVMLLGEEFGIHLPRGVTSFLASLGPVAAAMEAAFPFLAIIVGATVLLEHLEKLKAANAKASTEWGGIETAATKALNKMGDELLTVEMESDKLAGNTLAALQKQLVLIDHQSLSQLESEFDTLTGKIDTALAAGSRGTLMTALMGEGATNKVKAEFDNFKSQYDELMSQHKGSEARGVLVDEIIRAQAQLKKYQQMGRDTTDAPLAINEQTEAYGRLIPQLESINRLQDISSAIEAKKKANADTEARNAHPEDFNPELFVDAENKKRVSIKETIEAIKKEQAAANAADKLQVEGAEGLAKGLKAIEEERAKLAQESSKEDAGHGSKMAELQLAADKEAGQMRMAQLRMTTQEMLDMELSFNAKELSAQQAALNAELAALDQHDKAYENKKKQLNDKLLELDKQFQNKQQQLEDQSQMKGMSTLQTWLQKQQNLYTSEFSKVLMGKESFGKMMQTVDSQIAQQALSQLLSSVVALETEQGRERLSCARTAAAKAWADSSNPIMGAIEATATFAAVMALAQGGIVPGVGNGDIVPAMLTPGEAVLPKGLTEMLVNRSKFGDSGNGGSAGPDVHIHHHTTIQALDSTGMEKVLNSHADLIAKHTANHMRKMNR